MIESAAYDIIKQEGLQEGLKQGLKQGLQKGKIQEAQEAVLDILEARFDVVLESLVREVRAIEELQVLKALLRSSIKVATLVEFQELVKKARG
jgi:flagellar biosynthesis/type III secretory pathway protein FliH